MKTLRKYFIWNLRIIVSMRGIFCYKRVTDHFKSVKKYYNSFLYENICVKFIQLYQWQVLPHRSLPYDFSPLGLSFAKLFPAMSFPLRFLPR